MQLSSIGRRVTSTGKWGIYVDVEFKDGKAELRVTRIHGYGMDHHIKQAIALTEKEAESKAVSLAYEMFPEVEIIYLKLQDYWVPHRRAPK